jgi:hypothetical protein
VIVIFTKFDALEYKAFGDLRDENLPIKEARLLAPERAMVKLEEIGRQALNRMRYPPKSHVHLRGKHITVLYLLIRIEFNTVVLDMQKETTSCDELIKRTSAALDNEVLRRIFVTTQRNNVELCIEHAIRQ